MVKNVGDAISIVTYGQKLGSPYPWRAKFKIVIIGEPERFWRWARDFELKLVEVYGAMNFGYSIKDYINTACKKCSTGMACFRHVSLIQATDLIGHESNHEYGYAFRFKPVLEAEMSLGASGWHVIVNPFYAVVKRPNGKTFTYQAHKNFRDQQGFHFSSHIYISYKVIKFIHNVLSNLHTEVAVYPDYKTYSEQLQIQ